MGEDAKKLNEKTAKSAVEIKACLEDAKNLTNRVSEELSGIKDFYDPQNISEKITVFSSSVGVLSEMIKNLKDDLDSITGFLKNDEARGIKEEINALEEHLKNIESAVDTIIKAKNSISFDDIKILNLESLIKNLKDDLEILYSKVEKVLSDAEHNLNEVLDFSNSLESMAKDEALSKINLLIEKLGGNENFKSVVKLLEGIKAKIQNGESISIDALKLNVNVNNLLTNLSLKLDGLKKSLNSVKKFVADLDKDIKIINKALDKTGIAISQTLRSLKLSVKEIRDILINANNLIDGMKDLKIQGFSQNLKSVINMLDNIGNNLEGISLKIESSKVFENLNSPVDDAISLTKDTKRLLDGMISEIDGGLIVNLKNAITNVGSAASDIGGIFIRGIEGLDETKDFLEKLKGKTIKKEELKKYLASFDTYSGSLDEIAGKVRELTNQMDIREIAGFLKYNGAVEGDFFSSPVELSTTKLYAVKNYGAGLTPFYTTLSIWVGGLLIFALFSTKAHNAGFPFTPNQEFIGKYLFLLNIAVTQGLLVSLGDVFILRVEMAHPALFVCLAVFYSVVFLTILYTLVSLLNNVGKAIGVIFLVFQIAASGGTFPIQCTPEIFQKIYKFLPFTYAINGMREAVGGINYQGLVLDIFILFLFGVSFLAVGLIGKRYANNSFEKFTNMLKDSGVIH